MSEESVEKVGQLKFDENHIDPILRGQKTVTIRRDIDRDKFQIGKRFQLCGPEGERFASAIVYDRGWTTVDMAARIDWDGHRNYDETEELLDELQEYYPDHDLEPTSKVELVYWDWEELWE